MAEKRQLMDKWRTTYDVLGARLLLVGEAVDEKKGRVSGCLAIFGGEKPPLKTWATKSDATAALAGVLEESGGLVSSLQQGCCEVQALQSEFSLGDQPTRVARSLARPQHSLALQIPIY